MQGNFLEMKTQKIVAFCVMAAALVLAGCAGTPEPTIDPNVVYTQAASTVQAQLTETAAAMPTATQTPEPTATPVPPTATPTEILPTLPPVGSGGEATAVATATVAPTYSAGSTNPAPGKQTGDAATWGYNQPGDNQTFKPNEEFLLSWGFTNTGTTTWKPGYKWVFVSGQSLSGVKEVVLDREIKPGEKWEANIRAFLPGEEGTYISRWYLYNASGQFIEEFYFPFKIKK